MDVVDDEAPSHTPPHRGMRTTAGTPPGVESHTDGTARSLAEASYGPPHMDRLSPSRVGRLHPENITSSVLCRLGGRRLGPSPASSRTADKACQQHR